MTESSRTINRIAIACHEVGHALGARAAGLRVESLHVTVSAWDGWATGGHAVIDAPDADAPVTVFDGYAVMLFAGLAAELRYLDQVGALNSAVVAAVEDGAAGDYECWVQARGQCSISERQARARAAALVGAQWGRLVGRAELLLTRTRLAGSRV